MLKRALYLSLILCLAALTISTHRHDLFLAELQASQALSAGYAKGYAKGFAAGQKAAPETLVSVYGVTFCDPDTIRYYVFGTSRGGLVLVSSRELVHDDDLADQVVELLESRKAIPTMALDDNCA